MYNSIYDCGRRPCRTEASHWGESRWQSEPDQSVTADRRPKQAMSPPTCQSQKFRTMWWSSCATRPRLPSQLQGLPPLPRPRRRQSRSTASLPGSTSRRCARTSACPRRQSGLASSWRPRCPPSRTPRDSPREEWTRSSSRAASCRWCPRRARMPRRLPRLSTARGPSGKPMSRRVRCRRCPPGRRPAAELRACAGLSL